MKFLQKLTIYLTINSLSLGALKAEELTFSALSVSLKPNSLTLTLPLPKESELEKYIVKTSDENGYICHNFFREKMIKDKLFELKTKNEIIPELEKKAIEESPNVSMFSPNVVPTAIGGVLLGLLAGFFISRK